jgi:hypothetical protein
MATRTRVREEGAGVAGIPDDGPCTEPETSILLELPVSLDMPLVTKNAVPFGAEGAVMEKPKTCFATPKFPVPQMLFVHTTLVPPFST